MQAVRRELPGFPTASGYCTAFVFEAIARSYATNRWVLYSRILDSTRADLDKSRWATDAELGFDRLDWDIQQADLNPRSAADRAKLLKLLKPGDILFSDRYVNTKGQRQGHTGIYVGNGQVAENTYANRGQWFVRPSALRLTPLPQWDLVTSVGRIPSTWRP